MKIGHIIETNQQFEIITPEFLKTHSFLQAMTGGGKTGFLLKLVEEMRSEEFMKKYGYVPMILLDDSGEFLNIPQVYKDFMVLNNKEYAELFNIDDAFEVGKQTRQLGISMIIKVRDIGSQKDQETFVGQFIKGMMSVGREHWKPCVFVIDEAELYAPTKRKNVASKQPVIDLCKRARKTNLVTILATQFASDVIIDARRECANRIIGKTVELSDRKVVSEMLGDKDLVEKLWTLKAGEFYVRGDALSPNLLHVQVDESKIGTPDIGVKFVARNNKTVGDVLKVAMTYRSSEPMVVEQQKIINELEIKLEEAREKELTTEKKNEIWTEGREFGIREEKSKGILSFLKKDRSKELH